MIVFVLFCSAAVAVAAVATAAADVVAIKMMVMLNVGCFLVACVPRGVVLLPLVVCLLLVACAGPAEPAHCFSPTRSPQKLPHCAEDWLHRAGGRRKASSSEATTSAIPNPLVVGGCYYTLLMLLLSQLLRAFCLQLLAWVDAAIAFLLMLHSVVIVFIVTVQLSLLWRLIFGAHIRLSTPCWCSSALSH